MIIPEKTNLDLIRSMSADELAEKAVYELRIFIMKDPAYMSLLDCTCYTTRELAVEHNKEFLERKCTDG